eukprot:265951-Rhodomonas_salina.2
MHWDVTWLRRLRKRPRDRHHWHSPVPVTLRLRLGPGQRHWQCSRHARARAARGPNLKELVVVDRARVHPRPRVTLLRLGGATVQVTWQGQGGENACVGRGRGGVGEVGARALELPHALQHLRQHRSLLLLPLPGLTLVRVTAR